MFSVLLGQNLKENLASSCFPFFLFYFQTKHSHLLLEWLILVFFLMPWEAEIWLTEMFTKKKKKKCTQYAFLLNPVKQPAYLAETVQSPFSLAVITFNLSL